MPFSLPAPVYVLLLFLSSCASFYQPQESKQLFLPVEKEQESPLSKEVESIVAPYRQEMLAEMNSVIGDAPEALPKKQPESPLGNWMADALAERLKEYLPELEVDLVVLNYGGMRVPALPQGEINKGNIFEFAPFDNSLVVLEMSGEQLLLLLQHIRSKGGWPVSAGLRMQLAGEEQSLHGKAIEPEKIYYIGTNDYLAGGGDNCDFLVSLKRFDTGVFIRTALIEHIEKHKTLQAKIEGRIY